MLTQRDKEILKFVEEQKVITIQQASKIFFNNSKFAYDLARKRLKRLVEMQVLKSYKNGISESKVFYLEEKLSAHDIVILDFYSLLIKNKCENIILKKQPSFLNKTIRPDALFSFEFNDNLFFILLEVDLTHSSISKMQMYQRLYKSGELHKECYNTFPILVILSSDAKIKYETDTFDIIYMSFDMEGFENKVLGLS